MIVATFTNSSFAPWRPAPWTQNPGEDEQAWVTRMATAQFPAHAFTVVNSSTIRPPAPTPAELAVCAQAKATAVEAGKGGGLSFNLAAPGQPALVAKVQTSAAGVARLTAAVAGTWLNPSAPVVWPNAGSPITLTAGQLQTLANLYTAYLSAAQATLAAVLAAITAGTITTVAAIDAPAEPIAPWPTN